MKKIREELAHELMEIDQKIARLMFVHQASLTYSEKRLMGNARAAAEEAAVYLRREPVSAIEVSPLRRASCPRCHCLALGHHGPKVGCEGAGGNCGCRLTEDEVIRLVAPA